VSSVVLQQALADLNMAYRNFFASATGKRKGPKIAPPRFRSRKDRRQAVRFTANARFRVLGNGRLRLPRIGDVEVRWSRDLPAVPTSVTVIGDAAGRLLAATQSVHHDAEHPSAIILPVRALESTAMTEKPARCCHNFNHRRVTCVPLEA
jgi:putative transposase